LGQQKWTHVQLCISLRNHALDLECQVLGLGLKVKSLALALASDAKSLALALALHVMALTPSLIKCKLCKGEQMQNIYFSNTRLATYSVLCP